MRSTCTTSRKMAGCASTSGSVPVLGDRPNQPSSSFKFPKRKFGHAKPVYRTVQPAWFQKWPWLHCDQVGDRMFCYTCVQAYQQGSMPLVSKKKDTFISVGCTNWKDATSEKSGGFPTHEHSDVGVLSHIVNIIS